MGLSAVSDQQSENSLKTLYMNNNRRVLLIYPRHTKGWQAQPWIDMPMGLLCIATPVHFAGYDVRIIDQRLEPRWRAILQEELDRNPVCIGISSTTGPQLQYALEISRIAKENGNAPVVWGGVHPSILPEQTLENRHIDIVVQGEGEETFLELVKALDTKDSPSTVKGIWYKDNGRIRHTGDRQFIDLDKQPPLAYHLIEPRKYIRRVFGVERLSFITSRGCPEECTFCFNSVFDRRRWRSMDADIAVQRMKDFVNRYNVKGVFIIDSNFFVNMDWGRRVLEAIIREDMNIVITRIHISFNTLRKMNDDDFALLQRAGCKCISIGIESGSERIRKLLKKQIDVPRLIEINRNLKKFSIMPLYFFMIGFPTETKEDLAETVSLFRTLVKENPRASKSVNIYTPFPGTELYALAVKCGLDVPQRTEDWVRFNYRNFTRNAPWASKDMRKLIEVLDFCSFFADERSYVQPFKETNKLVVLLSQLYAPLARKRVEKLLYKFSIEVKLAKLLGLYAKQE